MTKIKNSVISETAEDGCPRLLEIVWTALATYGQLGTRSGTRHPYFDLYPLVGIHVMSHNGGFVANLEFYAPAGRPKILGTPDQSPYPTADEAFLAGARMVCEALGVAFPGQGDEMITAVQGS